MNQITESSRLQASRGRGGRILHLWHIGQPLQDGTNTLEVIWHSDMRDAIVMHDLHTSQLVVGRINISAQDLLWHDTVSKVLPDPGPFHLFRSHLPWWSSTLADCMSESPGSFQKSWCPGCRQPDWLHQNLGYLLFCFFFSNFQIIALCGPIWEPVIQLVTGHLQAKPNLALLMEQVYGGARELFIFIMIPGNADASGSGARLWDPLWDF